MAVPETAIDKHSHTCTSKYEIRLAENCLIATPAGDCCFAEKPSKSQLGIAISSRTDARHDGGTLLRRKHVRHLALRRLAQASPQL